jgi:hypothetical protein
MKGFLEHRERRDTEFTSKIACPLHTRIKVLHPRISNNHSRSKPATFVNQKPRNFAETTLNTAGTNVAP